MTTKLQKQLENAGLNASETKVYLHLLERGISSPPAISRGTDISRSNLHYILQGLFEKGLVKKQHKGKRFLYLPSDPKVTLALMDKKRKAVEEALSDLSALYKSTEHKPVIKFYEGAEELKVIFEDILGTKEKEVLGFASTNKLFKLIPDYFQNRFQKELRKREIFLQDILSEQSRADAIATKENTGPYYEYRFLPKDTGDLPTDMLVWDDKVAVMVLEPPVFGTVIENKYLADTYRAQFEIMWKSLPQPEKVEK